MAKPFGFYQFSESGTVGSGIVSAYYGYFSGYRGPNGRYTGLFTPEGMLNTPKAYLWGLDDDRYTPGNYFLQVSGDFQKTNIDSHSLEFSIYGKMYPVQSGLEEFFIRHSGEVVKDSIDNPFYYLNVTGSLVSGSFDSPTYSVGISGGFPKSPLDTFGLSNIISGNISPQFSDFPTYETRLSGNIIGYERDKNTLEFSIESISWTRGNPLVSGAITGEIGLSFGIEFISWSFIN